MRKFFIALTCFISVSICRAADTITHRVLAADKGHVAIVDAAGNVEWEFKNGAECHDLWLLPNGNVLLALSINTVGEVTPDKKIVWKYTAKPKAGYRGRVEVHGFQPLPDGRVMIGETGNKRIVEVNRDGKIVKEVPLTVDKPDPHRDNRMVRKLDNGHYLVCHEGDGAVREYDDSGKVVWQFKLDLDGRPASPGHGPEGHGINVFGAIRLSNGNTLIAGGNNNRVLEVSPDGQNRLVDRSRRAARHHARMGHDAPTSAERQHHHRQLPRRARPIRN